MFDAFDIVAKMSLDTTEFESELEGTKEEAENSGSSISNTFSKVKNAIVAAGVVTAVKDIGGAVINTGKEFDTAMSQVAATMGTSVDSIGELRDIAKEMGSTTAFTATQAAEGLNYLALAGYSTEQQIAALPTVLNLASAGAMDLGSASDMVTDAMSALGIEVTQSNLETFADQLAKTASTSNTSVSQLGEAILTVGGTAKTMAGGTTEASAALGILADNGIKASEGGTHLRNILLAMNPTTDSAAAAWKKLGVSAYTSDGKMKPLKNTFNELAKAMKGMTDQEKQDILSDMFNKTDLAAIEAMLGTTTDRWDELTEAIEGSWYTFDSLSSTFDEFGLSLNDIELTMSGMGVTTDEFDQALNQCGGDAKTFAELVTSMANEGTTYDDVVKSLGGNLEELQDVFDATGGAAEYMANTQLDNFEGSVTLMNSALDGLKLALWDTFSDQAQLAVDEFTRIITETQGFVEEHQPEISAAIELIWTTTSETFNTVGFAFGEMKGIFEELTGWDVNEDEERGVLFWLYSFQVGAQLAGLAVRNFFGLVGDGLGSIIHAHAECWRQIKEDFGGALEFLKGLLDFEWSLPAIQVPEIKWDWQDIEFMGLYLGSYPEFHLSWKTEEPPSVQPALGMYRNPVSPSTNWFSKAMNIGYMFKEPTVIGNYGFGDAGEEMVIGRNSMMTMIKDAQNEGMKDVVDTLMAMMEMQAKYFNNGSSRQIVLQDGTLVGALASPMYDEIERLKGSGFL